MRNLSEFRVSLFEISDELDMPEPIFVNVKTLKKWATGNGNANKQEMIKACIDRYRFTPLDDNVADACHLFYFFIRKYRIL